MSFNDINTMVDEFLGCVNWDMKKFCWENGYVSPVNEYNEFGEIIDDCGLKITGQDVLDALNDLGIDYSSAFEYELRHYGAY